jgi:tetratricopeptide (TPR) repeat protein
MNINH